MSHDGAPASTLVDLVFPLSGRCLPRDHGEPLGWALQAALPWLTDVPGAAVHPVNLVHGTGGDVGDLALISRRARLLLRLPAAFSGAAAALADHTLDVGGCPVQVGAPHARELLPHATLYAHAVAAPDDDEARFSQLVQAELVRLQVRAPWVCGKRHTRRVAGQGLTTFSLMVHALPGADSLRLQEHGMGGHRLFGCGIFVPHKSAAAVGE